MIRSILTVTITFFSIFIFAAPASFKFNRYKVQFWTCSKPNRHPLLMNNRLVTIDNKIAFASCISDVDTTCESNRFASIFTIQSLTQYYDHTIARVHTYSFDYVFDFTQKRSATEVSVRITSDTGYNVTCSTALIPFR